MDFLALTKIKALTFSVATIVLVLMTLIFIIQICNYYKVYKRLVTNSLEDGRLIVEEVKRNKKYFKKTEELVNDDSTSIDYKKENIEYFVDYKEIVKKKRKNKGIFLNILSFILYLILFALTSFFIYSKITGNVISINNHSYLAIKSESMETKNKNNSYLFDNNLDNQIEMHSLIKIKKIDDYTSLKLYDIVAFNDLTSDRIIVHRIIEIKEHDGSLYFTMRGDANSSSFTWESEVEAKNIIGVYTGFKNYYLGSLATYFTSDIGMIALALAILVVIYYELLACRVDKLERKRIEEIHFLIDEDIKKSIETGYEIHYLDLSLEKKKLYQIVPEEDFLSVLDETKKLSDDVDLLSKLKRNKSLSFKEKMNRTTPRLREMYVDIKNTILSYKITSRVSKSCDTFSSKRIPYIKIAQAGKSLKLYLRLDPKAFEDRNLPFKDASDKKKYEMVPVLFKVRSELSYRRSIKLINEMLVNEGFKKNDKYEEKKYRALINNEK